MAEVGLRNPDARLQQVRRGGTGLAHAPLHITFNKNIPVAPTLTPPWTAPPSGRGDGPPNPLEEQPPNDPPPPAPTQT